MILLTGATGFVGSALLPALQEASGEPVRAAVRREFDAVRLRQAGIETVVTDLRAGRGVDTALRGVRTLIYLAHTLDQPGDPVANDLAAIQNTLLAARAAGTERVIYLGSAAASERARMAYHLSRWAVELAVRQSGLHWTVLRAPIIIGPPTVDPASTPFEMIRRFVAHTPPVLPLFGWRRTPVEPVALSDVTEALTLAAAAGDLAGRLDRQAFDICGSERVTMGQLATGWARAQRRRRIAVPIPLGGEGLVSSAAWAFTRVPRRRTRLLLESLSEAQVCPDPSRRFPLPHRPLGVRAAMARYAGD